MLGVNAECPQEGFPWGTRTDLPERCAERRLLQKGRCPHALQVTAKIIVASDQMQINRVERSFNRDGRHQWTNRVMSSPPKIAPAPAIWFAEIGSPSQTAATAIATTGVR